MTLPFFKLTNKPQLNLRLQIICKHSQKCLLKLQRLSYFHLRWWIFTRFKLQKSHNGVYRQPSNGLKFKRPTPKGKFSNPKRQRSSSILTAKRLKSLSNLTFSFARYEQFKI